jgi:preprotein translocase subunit YajC
MRNVVGWLNWLAQMAPESGAPPEASKGGANTGFDTWTCLLPAAAGLMLMYLMMATKPRQGDPRKLSAEIANLKKNDRVITAGGIFGVVVQANADSDSVTVRIDDSNNTRIKVLKSSIARVLADDAAAKDKEA